MIIATNTKGKQMVQVSLIDAKGYTLTTWVENIPQLKTAKTLTLKEYPDRVWSILAIYKDVIIHSSILDLNRGWTNNI